MESLIVVRRENNYARSCPLLYLGTEKETFFERRRSKPRHQVETGFTIFEAIAKAQIPKQRRRQNCYYNMQSLVTPHF
jgi:hypothetical protein